MVVSAGGVDKRRQPVPTGILHHYVQRFGMVSPNASRHDFRNSLSYAWGATRCKHMLILRQ